MANHAEPNAQVAEVSPEAPLERAPPSLLGLSTGVLARAAAHGRGAAAATPGDVLAFQRLAGNRAVGALLARRVKEAEVAASDAGEQKPITIDHRKYVCVFAGYDTYGRDAREFARVVMSDHKLLEARSVEDLFTKLVKDAGNSSGVVRIDELVLIAHANDKGYIKMPLVPDGRGTSARELKKLKQEIAAGGRERFANARGEVLRMMTSSTDVIVRGCRAGRDESLVGALTALFGGQANVYVAKDYQAFTAVKAGTTDAELAAAYDHLIEQGMPGRSVYDDADKARWMRTHLKGGWVPESFFVSDENVAKVRKARKGDTSTDALKDFEDSQRPSDTNDRWAVGYKGLQDLDASYMNLTGDKILEEARKHLKTLRDLQATDPDNWMDISAEAWQVLRAERAWMQTPDALKETPPSASGDPLGGANVLKMPGMAYDHDDLRMLAGRRPDLRATAPDALGLWDPQLDLDPTPEATDEDEDLEVKRTDPRQAIAYKPRPGQKKKPPKSPLYMFQEDTIHSTPEMPITPLVIPQDEYPKEEYALVLRGELKRTFEFKYDPPKPIAGGYLLVKKAEVTLAGQLDFKGDGKKEILIGGLGTWSSKSGERTFGGADKGEITLVNKKSDSGGFANVKGGAEIGGVDKKKTSEGAQSDRGMKAELYISGEVGWGALSTDVKIVIVGIDETKSVADQISTGTGPFKILAIKWSPMIVTGQIDVPFTDGTKGVLKGKASLAFEAEPNWPKILGRVGQAMGREAVVAEGAAVAGGGAAITSGFAAVGAGELIIAGGFLAAGVATIWAYYTEVQEIESLKALARAADDGWDDFYAGFMTELGVPVKMKTRGGPLFKEGARHGKILLDWRVKAAARHLNDLHPDLKEKFTDNDPEVREFLKGVIADHWEQWGRACTAAYENAVRTTFYNAWRAKVGKTNAEHDDLNARARAQLKNLQPSDDPDYTWFKQL